MGDLLSVDFQASPICICGETAAAISDFSFGQSFHAKAKGSPFHGLPLIFTFFQKYLQKPLAISEKICYYIQVTWMMTSIKQIGA